MFLNNFKNFIAKKKRKNMQEERIFMTPISTIYPKFVLLPNHVRQRNLQKHYFLSKI